jgi:tRNA threonylcarbamoyladenosine biosynthesis protein TsaB
MAYLLHIDTSTDSSTVSISYKGTLTATVANEQSRNHAGTINQMVEQALETATITFAQLGGIAVCAGPGSYTGLRIGLATAKGLCYALDIPLILDNKLALLASQAQAQHGKSYAQYISLLIAREKEYFIAVYDNALQCTVEAQHIMEQQWGELVDNKTSTCLISNVTETTFAKELNNLHIEGDVKINIKNWAKVAFEKYNCNNIVNLQAAEPFYLKQVYTHK